MPDLWMDVDIALSEVPVNLMPLIDDTDFKTIEDSIAYNASGMDLRWNFVTTGGAMTSTPVTPTSAGAHDWTHQGDGLYTLEIPATSGTINNDTEGFGWFSGKITGVLPFRGPTIGFRAAALNDALIDGGDNLDVNVTQFGGSNGTFSGGRPETNATHWGGTAVGSANVLIDGAITAAKIAGDAIDASKIASDAISEIQAGLATASDLTDIETVTDKLNTALESDGSSGWQFTSLALENAPSGGGGTDWTADERTAIRAILGIPGSGTTPADPSTGILDTIRDLVVTVDTVADGIKAKTDNLPSDPADQSLLEAAITTATSPLATASSLSTVASNVAAILADTGTDGVVVAAGSKAGYELASGERDAIAAAILDLAAGIQTDWTLRQALRVILAVAAGKISGADTSTVTIRDPGDTKDRVVATVAAGGRTAVTYDKT
jgi:hypothetical protein